jgi:hypothetical protein
MHKWKIFLIHFDKFLKGWKTFISMLVLMVGLYIMPEGKGQYIVQIAGIALVLIARTAKIVNKNDL